RYPSWSPDGTVIAFTSERDGNSEIYIMNADGSGQTRLTNHPADDRSADWQPLLVGDVNCQGGVTIVDAQLIAQKIVGRIDALPCAKNGDVNGSGGVTIADAQLIAQLIVGRIPSLPAP
ncbi:MAG: PD40 domain-containing protein, partial [Chloroflexi bacterium]|nr:PD40 domain-containing protein [Chloroflexota bacterium]